MRVPSFDIQNQRGVHRARCDAVPQLMIIAGPNGTGKSTVLHGIRAHGWENIIYLGPHRAMRRQQVAQGHLIATPFLMEDLLTRPNADGYAGVQLLTGARDPWGHDDAVNYLKHTLCQVEIDFQVAIADRYRKDGEIKKGSLPEIWQPLRELSANLLPHLRFEGIDAKDRNQIRCLWAVHGAKNIVDIDELSSGEKSIIQMFFPLVERRIRAHVAEVSGSKVEANRPEQCVLIDEPELHLHPNLQIKVLDYLRVLTAGTKTQVILATHSPTIVESASFEELFLLRPVELVSPEENQLVQVATDSERLQALRDLFGGASNLTSMQTVVVVEGVREDDARRVSPDRKLYRALHPGFDHVTIVPGGGKSQCEALVNNLAEAMKPFSQKINAVGLLDRDYEGNANSQVKIVKLPVTMIENFLIDPDAIWHAIQSVVEKTELQSMASVELKLAAILDELEANEIERRAIARLGFTIFRPKRPLDEVPSAASAFCSETLARFSADAIKTTLDESKEQVALLKTLPRRREEFHGKDVLEMFYKKHLHATPLSRVVFTFETARHARTRSSVKSFFDSFFLKVTPDWKLPDSTTVKPPSTDATETQQ